MNPTQINKIFDISSIADFNETAMEIFRFQSQTNTVYREFIQKLRIKPEKISTIEQIPFLPIEFFKIHPIISGEQKPEHWFESSGTTGMAVSRHFYSDLTLYEKSFFGAFAIHYGQPQDYCILALLPSYLERERSSLVYMAGKLIKASGHPESGFYLDNLGVLAETLTRLDKSGQKVMLFGVSFALLDLIEKQQFNLKNTIIIETGGMKGRKKEMVRDELHIALKSGFGVDFIHSEYGMTELFSQAWSKGEGKFASPPWMGILIRDVNDPLSLAGKGASGGINIIDLANVHSCSFVATQDLGRILSDGTFEVLGRFDEAEIRGCNLLVA